MAEARARAGPEAEEAGEAAAVCVAVLLGLPGAGKTALDYAEMTRDNADVVAVLSSSYS